MATKKDYELVADVIAKVRKEVDAGGNSPARSAQVRVLNQVTLELSAAFGDENPKFQPKAFYARCRG